MRRPRASLVIFAAAGLAELSFAAAPVFTCTQGPATLSVAASLSDYSVSVAGAPWLAGGGVTVHASGAWLSSRAAAGGLCSFIADTDCVGNDVMNTTAPVDAAACCALCEAQGAAACAAWSYQGDHCYLKNGCANPVAVPGVVSGVAGGSALTAVASRAVVGADAAGVYDGYEVTWQSAAAGVTVVTTVACYRGVPAIGFTTAWPGGGAGTNTTDPGTPSAWGPSVVQFPSFDAAASAALRWLHVDGIWTLNEAWGTGLGALSATDSPVWLLNASAPGDGTLLLAPLDSLKAQRVGAWQDPAARSLRMAAGLYSTVAAVPAGFNSTYALWASPRGVSEAALAWGAAMQAIYGTQRLPTSRDVLNRKLSYWSDNGATLFQSYWDTHCPTRNCTAVSIPNGTNAESTFLALKASHAADGLPFGLYQLDTWWFTQWADRQPGGSLDCAEWWPREDLWPRGLPAVTQADIPLLLYSWGWVTPAHGNTMTNFTWVPSPDGKEAMVSLDEVYSFYSMIRDRFLALNGTSYETDNTDSFTSSWAQSREGVDTASRYWAGFAAPWCEAGIPVQTCEATASDLMESLRWGCVTSQRDTIDDVPGAHGGSPLVPGGGSEPFFLHRWRVGHDRLLMAALAQRPFFDNVWSTEWQNKSTWAGAPETYVELAFLISVLSAGAVGVGDFPGDSNKTLIMTACRADGVLLTASLPSFYVDAIYLPRGAVPGLDPTAGRIYQASTFLPDSPAAAQRAAAIAAQRGNYDLSYFTGAAPAPPPFLTLLSIDVNSSVALAPSALAPDLTPAVVSARAGGGAEAVTNYVAVPWSRGFAATAAACADGAAAAPCAAPFSPAQPLDAFTGAPALNSSHDFELWSLAPRYANGYALLGELGKVVRVSAARVPWVRPSLSPPGGPPSLAFAVVGAPGEAVDIAVLAPTMSGGDDGVVRRVAITLPAGGAVNVTCVGLGPGSTCAVDAPAAHAAAGALRQRRRRV